MPSMIWWEKGKQNSCCKPEEASCKLQLEWGAQEGDSSKRDESVLNDAPLLCSSYKNLCV